ncbi:MAG: addiction module protein [Verrucomicrobiota bacterium]
MSLDQIIPAALQLPAKERALLAASLWESIADPYAHGGQRSDEDAVTLALARDEELENGMVSPLSHADLMQQLRA